MSCFDKVVFTLDGIEYRYSGGFGVQLTSIENLPLQLGTLRYIAKRIFYVFSCRPKNRWSSQYEIGWSMPETDADIDTSNQAIRDLRSYLQDRV